MSDNSNNEIWVFLSHSNKDYEKVRQVRNLLEEQSLRPLMFFLHCLNDDEEIDSLIKREIDCRTRFILCDSENARSSHWVQKEVEYIKSKNRVCETIDLSKSMEEIMSDLQDFINKTRIFISYNREEYQLAELVYKRLSQYDFSVYMDTFWNSISTYHQSYKDALDFLEDSVVKMNGYVIAIMNERVLNNGSSSRYELAKAIRDNRNIGKNAPNIIPFVTDDSLLDKIAKDQVLAPLIMCNIHSLEKSDIEQQCDQILERVITQLMTPGSIEVQAESLSRDGNTKEAGLLNDLLKRNCNENTLMSESGVFFIDENGIVQRFEPAENNQYIDEETDIHDNYTNKTYKSISTMIIPDGVKGFVSDFMRGIRVLKRFELPKDLLRIGNNSYDIKEKEHCVFADCILPTVIIPQNVQEIGTFAFGHTHIDTLQLPSSLHSPYGRQFKDSYINTLRLPHEWEGIVSLDKCNRLCVADTLNANTYGYLRWPSTHVERLEYY